MNGSYFAARIVWRLAAHHVWVQRERHWVQGPLMHRDPNS